MPKINTWIVLGAVVCCLVLTFGQYFFAARETVSWGLHFSADNQPPSAPADRDSLRKLDTAYMGDPGSKVIWLTFDAGYENGSTEAILDALQKHNAPAVFFLCGNYLERNPDLVRRMAAEGHTVGNHTMHHPDMSAVTDPAKFEAELSELAALYEQITGKPMEKYYRPPQGKYSDGNLEQAKKLGYKTVLWSLAYADWDNENQPDPAQAVEKLTKRVHNGAVVLLHSTSKTNAQILDQLLTQWENMGYRFAPIGELFKREGTL
jgi:peptidoglycan-N-acetylmuramic acid deacetylase